MRGGVSRRAGLVAIPGMVAAATVLLSKGQASAAEQTVQMLFVQGAEASLGIDIIGMPLTPLSFAGVARRDYRRAVLFR